MTMLSQRTKEAIKTALAMTIAYGIALAMDWDKPMWAGFAVAFISLSTVGQSLNKGAMRMLGTLFAVVVSLTILSLFPQDRWGLMAALSVFVGLCTYLMGGGRRQYFWNVAGFVTAIICLEASGTSSEDAFNIALLRAEETGLGILVYSLVAILLWPTNTRDDLDRANRDLHATQHALYGRYRRLIRGEGSEADSDPLRMQEVQQFGQFRQALAAAQTDTYEVHEVRRHWLLVQDQRKELMEALERWRESMEEIRGLDLRALMPNIVSVGDEVQRRFQQIGRMLDGKPPKGSPQVLDIATNKEAVRGLSHFETAALAVARTQMLRIESLTRDLLETVADIRGFGSADARAPVKDATTGWPVPDPDRIAAAVRTMVTLWLAYLLWIYTEIPGGVGFVVIAGSLGMAVASMPQVPVSLLFVPAAVSVAFASILYILVMPQLASFVGLGLMIFAVTFAICYLFAAPRQMLGRAFGLAMFVTIAGISNEQSYNFLSVANTAMMFPLVFALLAITAYIPVSTRPEQAYQRLLARFFRSCEYLMSTLRWDPTRSPSALDRWKRAFHVREVATLPAKLGAWSMAIDTKALPGTTPQQVQALTNRLQALTYRMQELLEARQSPQADLLVRELLADVRAWRLAVQGIFQGLARDPAAVPASGLRERLTAKLDHLEQRIEATLNKAADGELTERDGESFYRLLGAYRGLSEATINYAASAGGIDWSRWHEARF